ncbi:MAG: lytic transglycosylase domain-containing protein [Clostridia bacterium]|nr:lytic transglycosylase domain-containing protein [Clostridia bacterium]
MKSRKWKHGIIWAFVILLLLNSANIARLVYPVKHMSYIKQYAAKHEVDPYLIMSIIKSESNFDQNAVSSMHATGLMQIMEPTAVWLAEGMGLNDFQYEDITDPALNINMGCYYVAYLLRLYDGNVKNALAAYNAGEGTVDRWLLDEKCSKDGKTLQHIPYHETRHYITQVTNNVKIYRILYKIRQATEV